MMVKVFTILGKMIVVISCTNDLVQDPTPPQELIQIVSLDSQTGTRQSQDQVVRRGPGIQDLKSRQEYPASVEDLLKYLDFNY